MPILPENRNRYPDNWKEIRERILTRAGQTRDSSGNVADEAHCEKCGAPNHERIIWKGEDWEYAWSDEDGAIQIVLTIAHLDHTPENCDPENLRAWCQRCHNRYDVGHRKQTRRASREIGQMRLFEGTV